MGKEWEWEDRCEGIQGAENLDRCRRAGVHTSLPTLPTLPILVICPHSWIMEHYHSTYNLVAVVQPAHLRHISPTSLPPTPLPPLPHLSLTSPPPLPHLPHPRPSHTPPTTPPLSRILSCTTRPNSPSCSSSSHDAHIQPEHTIKLGTLLTSNILGFNLSASVSLPSGHHHCQLDIRIFICQPSHSLSSSCNSCQIYFLRCFCCVPNPTQLCMSTPSTSHPLVDVPLSNLSGPSPYPSTGS
jgi:hypothetical protein